VAEALRAPDEPTVEHRPRRFGVRAEQEEARDRRVEQHELRLDALTNRLSAVALRTAALQASQDAAPAVKVDIAALADELTTRLDTVVIEQMEAAAAHELTVKLVSTLLSRLEENERRLTELTEAVDHLATKTRSQAGQLTKLRNHLKAQTEPAPTKTASSATAKRPAAKKPAVKKAATSRRAG
jgi:hypothetical protein